jgi:hypothetical protein
MTRQETFSLCEAAQWAEIDRGMIARAIKGGALPAVKKYPSANCTPIIEIARADLDAFLGKFRAFAGAGLTAAERVERLSAAAR